MNVPFQYLAEVVVCLQGESNDKEFVASFALQFLVMECMAAWSALHANIVNALVERMWTTTWGSSVVISGVCVWQELIEITPHRGLWERIPRKDLEAHQQMKGRDAIKKALMDGKESQNRRATTACITLLCTAVGK